MFKLKKMARFVRKVPASFGYSSPNNILKLGQAYPIEADLFFGKQRIIQVKGFKKYFPSEAFEIFEE